MPGLRPEIKQLKEMVWESRNAIGQRFKDCLVIFDSGGLTQFKQSPSWVIKVRWSKPEFESIQEHRPEQQLVVGMHPPVPDQSFPLHVERSYSQSLFFSSVMEIEELVDFENPTQNFRSIETRYFQFNGSICEAMVLLGVGCVEVKSRRRYTSSDLVYFSSEVYQILLE